MRGYDTLHGRPGAAVALARHTCSNFAIFTLAPVHGKDATGLWKVNVKVATCGTAAGKGRG